MNSYKDVFSFFDKQLTQQFGESAINGAPVSGNFYDNLGSFGKNIDQTEQRQYVEEGFLNNNFFKTNAKRKEVVWNQPEATVLVKKRMFSSLKENYKEEYLDNDEYLFVLASKKLFSNKAKQISSYEKLTKLQQIVEDCGYLDISLLPTLSNSLESLSGESSLFFQPNSDAGILIGDSISLAAGAGTLLSKVKQTLAFYAQNKTTTWITKNYNLFDPFINSSLSSNDTGVFELTNFTNLNTSCSVKNVTQTGSLSLADPYDLSTIKENDIEAAISSVFGRGSIYLTSINQKDFEETIELKKQVLSSLRKGRGAPDITFYYSSQPVVGRKVSAILTTGEEILFDDSKASSISISSLFSKPSDSVLVFDDSKITGPLGQKGLNKSEEDVFADIIALIYRNMLIQNDISSAGRIYNEKTNFIRRKMNLHFLGKNIIQPMDEIHIYLKSRQTKDEVLLKGIKETLNGVTLFDKLSTLSYNVGNDLSRFVLDNPENDIEQLLFGFPEMPKALWAFYRDYFVKDSAGTHVFGGLVTSASSSATAETYSVSVAFSDMTTYLKKGKVNFNPGLSQFNGAFFDPLTPFKSSFDDINYSFKDKTPEFLDVNKKLLSSSYENSLAKLSFGNNSGTKATIDSTISDADIGPDGKIKNIMYAPDGLLYRWKQGIGVITQFGNSSNYNESFYTGRTRLSDPFIGQDIMNIISLCVTGTPYNYYNYYKATKETSLNSDLYYQTLENDLVKTNQTWGNFLPFKGQSVSASDVVNLYITQQQATSNAERLAEIASNLQSIYYLTNSNQGATTKFDTNELTSKQLEIDALSNAISESLNSEDFRVIGNDIDLYEDDYGYFGAKNASDKNKARKKVSKKINSLTRRVSRKVRENSDNNLFIVDDDYDYNLDIQAFEKQIQNTIDTYNSVNGYLDTYSKIVSIAHLLDLEVFSDTQGHIRVRTPKYNKIPSSVFYRMLEVSKQRGITLFPKFLENLFKDQIKNQLTQLEIIEDEIRLYASIICKPSAYSDDQVQEFINKYSKAINSFAFISDTNGIISYLDDLLKSKDDISSLEKSLDITFDAIKNQRKLKNILGTAQLIKGITSQNGTIQNFINNKLNIDSIFNSYTKTIINRLKLKTGRDLQQEIINEFINNNKVLGSFDFISASKKLQNAISSRQKSIDILSKAFRKIKEASKINSLTSGNTPYSSLSNSFNNLSSNTKGYLSDLIDSGTNGFFSGLIEDESVDDLGPGSGKRYVLSNSVITGFNISEQEPPYTYVQVSGVLGDYVSSSLPNTAFDNGGLVTAAAIDYDMWHMYGFNTNAQTVKVPAFTSAENQCAPYAAYLLSKARKDILKGTINIIGNEYMQPGEVIYLPQKNLLFYIETVTHNFSVNSSFTTTLTVSYGHTPGEYIPTSLDVIGKTLYNNATKNDFVVYRDQTKGSMGVLSLNKKDNNFGLYDDFNKSTLDKLYVLLKAAIANSNKTTLNQISKSNLDDRVRGYESKNDQFISIPKLELRVYSSELFALLNGSGFITLLNNLFSKEFKKTNTFNPSNLSLKFIDINESSPSQAAWGKARSEYVKINSAYNDINFTSKDVNDLFGNIIDCYIIFENGSVNVWRKLWSIKNRNN